LNSNRWSISLFKGRLGEAVVEAVLTEFGYEVMRAGYESLERLAAPDEKPVRGIGNIVPDLYVTNPRTGKSVLVEVKLRSVRPMKVVLQARRFERLRESYPETIIVFVSTYDGTVNCDRVGDIDPTKLEKTTDGLIEFDLYRHGWKPIWHFFDLVQPGERLTRLSDEIDEVLHSFGKRRVLGADEVELVEGEADRLRRHIASRRED